MKITGIDHEKSSEQRVVYILDGPMTEEQEERFRALGAARGWSKSSVKIQGRNLSVKPADMEHDSLRQMMFVLAQL